METIKDVATVVGCVMSCMALITAVCKPIRQKFVSFVIHFSGKDEVEKQLAEIKKMITERDKKDAEFQRTVLDQLQITTDFTVAECRGIIKDTFYKYKDSRVLPLYEKKRLMEIQELYITRLHQNHWGKTLLDAMADWDVDASHTDIIGIEDE